MCILVYSSLYLSLLCVSLRRSLYLSLQCVYPSVAVSICLCEHNYYFVPILCHVKETEYSRLFKKINSGSRYSSTGCPNKHGNWVPTLISSFIHTAFFFIKKNTIIAVLWWKHNYCSIIVKTQLLQYYSENIYYRKHLVFIVSKFGLPFLYLQNLQRYCKICTNFNLINKSKLW